MLMTEEAKLINERLKTVMNPNRIFVGRDLNLPSTKAMAEPTAAARAIVDTETITEFRKFK